jgi:hypothetical protein
MRNVRGLACGAVFLAGCVTVPAYSPVGSATVYVEQGADGNPVASATDREIAALSTVPPVVGAPVFTYRPPYYAYPYAGWPSTSMFFSWSNPGPWYPYRGWGAPPPRYRVPPPPRYHAPPPARVHPPAAVRPPVAAPAPPAAGRPPPGGYRGMFGNPTGRKR